MIQTATETIGNGDKIKRTRSVRIFVLLVRLMTCFSVLTQLLRSIHESKKGFIRSMVIEAPFKLYQVAFCAGT